jgi:predicted ribosomally synthesized peptide with nif11-like leader
MWITKTERGGNGMSVQDAKSLVAKLQTDGALRQKFQSAGEQAFETVAQQEGHNVSVTDLHHALSEASFNQVSKLKNQLPGGASSIIAIASVAVI